MMYFLILILHVAAGPTGPAHDDTLVSDPMESCDARVATPEFAKEMRELLDAAAQVHQGAETSVELKCVADGTPA